MEKYIAVAEWPMQCPHPLCEEIFGDVAQLEHHFFDAHGIGRRPAATDATSRKRRTNDSVWAQPFSMPHK